MISSELTISLASWALAIEQQRAAVSADNIFRASSGGIKRTGNFEDLISDMSSAVSSRRLGEVESLLRTKATIEEHGTRLAGTVALDEEIVALSQAKGKFKVISEALAKKYGLMNLAAGGK
jgi:flagellar basal body rod protein FlgB